MVTVFGFHINLIAITVLYWSEVNDVSATVALNTAEKMRFWYTNAAKILKISDDNEKRKETSRENEIIKTLAMRKNIEEKVIKDDNEKDKNTSTYVNVTAERFIEDAMSSDESITDNFGLSSDYLNLRTHDRNFKGQVKKNDNIKILVYNQKTTKKVEKKTTKKKVQKTTTKKLKKTTTKKLKKTTTKKISKKTDKKNKNQKITKENTTTIATTSDVPQPIFQRNKMVINNTTPNNFFLNFDNKIGLRTNNEKKIDTITASNKQNRALPRFYAALRQNETETPSPPPKVAEPVPGDEFLSPFAIIPQMMRILEKFSNANVTPVVLGRTVEYNDIVLFKVTINEHKTDPTFRSESKYIVEAPERKIIFIVHGLTVMGLNSLPCLTEEDKTRKLIEFYMSHLDKFDIFIIPIANPDGYVASRGKTGVFWNKNKSPQRDCSGVMLDRNFDVAWNATIAQSSCTQSYPGPNPFSEAETRAVRDVLHYHGHKIMAYIHVHAGTYDTNTFKGDAVLYPRGFTELQADDDKYIDIRGEIDEALKNANFQLVSVTVDTLHSWYGKVSGTSVDYAATVYGIPFAMEFVMQLYGSSIFASADEDLVDYSALTQIWKRVIDVVFNYIERTLQYFTTDKKKKK